MHLVTGLVTVVTDPWEVCRLFTRPFRGRQRNGIASCPEMITSENVR